MQYRFAKGVDGEDAQAPRRFQRPGKEGSRLFEQARCRLVPDELADRRAQVARVHHRPLRQPVANALAHLGGGRLGIGEAEDGLRLHPGEQQAQHPIGEHEGLAGPGIGLHPDGISGVARQGLARPGVEGDVEVAAIAHGSSSPSTAVHSATRARWS